MQILIEKKYPLEKFRILPDKKLNFEETLPMRSNLVQFPKNKKRS